MTFVFRPARRNGSKLLVGLAGPTGSGKTYSALKLASGIVAETGGRIAFIDTESGRAKQYAPPGDDTFDFDYCELPPPFSPLMYLEAFEAAEEHAGAGGVVIIDSTSHEHEGPGGVLEWHDAEMQRMGGERMNFAAWAKPKAARRQLVNRIVQSRCHLICCFRAKQKSKQVKNDRTGKSEIVDIGWQPITGDEWPYEMTIFALLNPERKGVPIIDNFDHGKLPINMRALVPTDSPITSDTGRKLGKWAGAPKVAKPDHDPATGEVHEPAPNGGAKILTVWLSPETSAYQAPGKTAIAALRRAINEAETTGQLSMLRYENRELIGKIEGTNNGAALNRAIEEAKARVKPPEPEKVEGETYDEDGGPRNEFEREVAELEGEEFKQGSMV